MRGQRGGRERDVLRPTGTEGLWGRGRRLRQRWPARWVQRSPSVTWLPGLLSSPVSSLRGADGADDTTVEYLLQAALVKKKEEEKERKEEEMLDILRRFRADLPVSDAEWEAWRGIGFCGEEEEEEEEEGGRSAFFTIPRIAWLPGILVGMDQKDIYAATQRPLPLPALYALGNPDFLRTTGIWHPVRCLSCQRNTGNFGVFWEFTTRNYFYGPLYLAVICAVYSTTRQSLVPSSPLGVQEYGFFWKTASGMLSVFSSPWFDSGYMLGVSLRGLLFRLQKTADSWQLQFIVGRRHPLRSAEADPHGPDCSADHRDSSDAVRFQVVDAPVVQVVLAIPVVVNDRCARLRLCRKPSISRSCSSSRSFSFLSVCRGGSHGLTDHRNSPVLGQGR